MKGKFFVLDGTDGSGKGTQTALIVERLRKEGFAVEVADFPQYGKPSAVMVEQYLNGAFGTAQDVGPYRASILYAIDRYAASFEIRKWIDEGKVVIANRYVSSNMGHQAGKIKDPTERKRFLDWVEDLEFNIFNIPRPDNVLVLYVPSHIGQRLVDQKSAREYTGGKKRDIHEADLEHLRDAERSYLDLVETQPDWIKIDCYNEDSILPREVIHEMVWNVVSKKLER